MKNSEFQELSMQELEDVDGGSLLAAACITLAVLYLAGTCAGLAQGHKFNGQP